MEMKIPLDQVCVRSGLLCNRCQGLVDEGEVLDYEIEIMKMLLELEETQFKELRECVYHKAYKVDNLLILLVTSSPEMTQQKWIKIAKILQDKLNIKVRVLEKTNSIKNSAIQLLSPARVLGVNTVWMPDGSVQYVIRVSKSERKLLPAEAQLLESALTKIHSTPVRIRVE
ncbi:transcription elongation factor NusA [Sulfolobus sp. A20-N-F6]|uniref:transcription elongation factor NusA n=1 Tax=Saccharolobus sp. A20 TaxID=1891280 RepID=UPI0009F3EF18|nr:transcription elongation factor NusA [Sulfolobus sp. A20]TRM76046.1 transcription elongation factor NusA [Sulfolobus sp. B5]TRM77807.1 transcription elongation factor NusA [Sulfolobus sp. A20-N-F8]TRM81753.1 transcription elongation factor NusA [Sulfolobus sp. A20-N-F6]